MNHEMKSNLPKVSVIVPVYNCEKKITKHIMSLQEQTHPKELYEIIIVDNDSTDYTREIAKEFPVKLLIENRAKSPYLARNKGITEARGDIIAFIDINCTPVHQWIAKGVHTLESSHADLLGGKVTFTFSPQKTSAEIYDSLTNVQMKINIETRGVAKGGNLFVRRHVFEVIGLFPEYLRSGGDVLWTKKATAAGMKLVYAPEAEVFYPARKLIPLLKKQFRVGRGQPFIWKAQGQNLSEIILRIFLYFCPVRLKKIQALIIQRGTRDMLIKTKRIWIIANLVNVSMGIGRISAIFRHIFLLIMRKMKLFGK